MTNLTVSRFWSKVDRSALSPGGCWTWTRAKNGDGYGVLGIGGRGDVQFWLAHRLSYVMAFGEIPDGLLVRHRCDTPSCVNPSHLHIGTQSDNMQDSIKRGSFMRGRLHDPPKKRRPRTDEEKAARRKTPRWQRVLAERMAARS